HAPPPTRLSTLSLHDALPIFAPGRRDRAVPALRSGHRVCRARPLLRAPRTLLAYRCGRLPPPPRRAAPPCAGAPTIRLCRAPDRSEEHTSELQSRGHLVCRLL